MLHSGRYVMPKYLMRASYTAEGLKGLQKDKASGRKAAITQALEGLGGKLESLYFTFGEDDAGVILRVSPPVQCCGVVVLGRDEHIGGTSLLAERHSCPSPAYLCSQPDCWFSRS